MIEPSPPVDNQHVAEGCEKFTNPCDGGPAFPRSGYVMSQDCAPEQWQSGYEGMSLRDYFAGEIVTALISNENLWGAFIKKNPGDIKTLGALAAANAYLFADAMLAERARADSNSQSK